MPSACAASTSLWSPSANVVALPVVLRAAKAEDGRAHFRRGRRSGRPRSGSERRAWRRPPPTAQTPRQRCVPSPLGVVHAARDDGCRVSSQITLGISGTSVAPTFHLNRQRPPHAHASGSPKGGEMMKKSMTIALAVLQPPASMLKPRPALTPRRRSVRLSTGVDPDARGKVKLAVRNLSDGKLEIKGQKLDPNATLTLVDGPRRTVHDHRRGNRPHPVPQPTALAERPAARIRSAGGARGRAQRRRAGRARRAARRQWVGGRRRGHLLHSRRRRGRGVRGSDSGGVRDAGRVGIGRVDVSTEPMRRRATASRRRRGLLHSRRQRPGVRGSHRRRVRRSGGHRGRGDLVRP